MQRRRAPDRAKVSVRQAAGHFAMGASLGTAGALLLMIDNVGAIRDVLTDGSSSGLPVAVFVGASACAVAVGATLTGIRFSALDQD